MGIKKKQIAVCVIGRRENEYAREFVAHYLSVGFDTVIILDNNRAKEERFESVLQDYIDSGKVIIEDYRDRTSVQGIAYDEAYKKYGEQYDWIAFVDFDEYLYIEHGKVRSLLKGKEAFDCVLVNWMCYGDGGMLHNDGRPLRERFTEPLPYDLCVQYDFPENNHIKSIVRGGLKDVHLGKNPHIPSSLLHCCTASGKECAPSPFQPYDFSVAHLKHYATKTAEEWITNKWQKGTPDKDNLDAFRRKYADRFFKYNERTQAKEDFIRIAQESVDRRRCVVIVHYNTPELTEAAIRSLNKHTPGCHVIVFDNSDERPFTAVMSNVEVLDNTKGQLIDFTAWLDTFKDREPSPGNDYGSAKHCYSVQWIFEHRKRPFVLMDSDVLIKEDISFLWDNRYVFTGHVGCNTRRFGFTVNRLEPFLCYIDMPIVRTFGLTYFNPRKMWNLVSDIPDSRYDTGAWFLEQCKARKLSYRDIDLSPYTVHLRHGSWKDKDVTAWMKQYKSLYD